MKAFLIAIGLLICCGSAIAATGAKPSDGIDNIRALGAIGDGKTLDTPAVQKAIDACSSAGGGEVLVPTGHYLIGTVHLKSNVTILLEAGAELIGTTDLNQYQSLNAPQGTQLASQSHWHRALILGENVENVTITGRGTIDGNKVFDPQGEERMRGPHALLFGHCRNITLRDISIKDAANYAVMLEFTSDVEVRGVKITGGWDGIHFRGWKDDPCRNVSIIDCQLYTGDDCIAGWYWENTLIDHCILNSSCNGIRLIGPAQKLIVHDCLFLGPGRNEHRTSGPRHRTNMLAGLCLQPSAWDRTEGIVDDVHISDVTMHDVTTALHLSTKPGATVGRVTIDRLNATGLYRAAASIESWAKEPIGHVTLRDVSLEFTGGGTPEQAAMKVRSPGVDARPLPAWALYARNVKSLDLFNVRLTVDSPDARPAMMFDGIDSLDVDHLRWHGLGAEPMVLNDVKRIDVAEPGMPIMEAQCNALRVDDAGRIAIASVIATRDGLAKIEVTVDEKPMIQWQWLRTGRKKDVEFAMPSALDPHRSHRIQCGKMTADLKAPKPAVH